MNDNTGKTLKNSIISITAYVINLLLQFIGRRVFIIFLDIEYLGYQSLFSNVFSLLSVAELGVGGIISFHLYKELVQNNQQEIGKLMYLYKWVYRIIAVFVLTAGILCVPFLHNIVKNPTASWNYLYKIYFLQLASVVFGYFLSYRRTIYIANQKEYKCVQIDLYAETIVLIAQIVVLALFKNYLLYLGLQLFGKLLSNVIIAIGSNRDYPYLREKYTVKTEDIRRRNLIPDIKNYLVHKVSYIIFGGTDNIIITAFCGIRDVALYGNYYMLGEGVKGVLISRLLSPVQATIGNIVYSDRTKEQLWEQFQVFDVFSFFFASYTSIGFLVFFQPAIQVWMGKEYLLPFSFVLVYSLFIYYGVLWEIIYKYRAVFGDYAQDRNCMLLSAVLNVVVSIACVRVWGITGVQIGTLVAFFPMAYGRIRFVVGGFFKQSVFQYFRKHLLLSVAAAAEGAVCWLLTRSLAVSVGGIALRFVVWASIPMAVNLLIFWRDPQNAIHIIENKLTEKKTKKS